MFIEELAPYNYCLPFSIDSVRCVGWLSSEHPYQVGEAPAGLLAKLKRIILHRTDSFDAHVNVVRGIDPCDICDEEIALSDSCPLGMSEIWVPSESGWLASPSLVYHFISVHQYLPPTIFVDAIMGLDTDQPYLGQPVYKRLMSAKMSEHR